MKRKSRIQRSVNFQDTQGPDVTALIALELGKGYEAASKIAGLTEGQVNYRAKIAREMGMQVSPRTWRKSARLPGDISVRQALTALGQCNAMMREINSKLIKHYRSTRAKTKKSGR